MVCVDMKNIICDTFIWFKLLTWCYELYRIVWGLQSPPHSSGMISRRTDNLLFGEVKYAVLLQNDKET